MGAGNYYFDIKPSSTVYTIPGNEVQVNIPENWIELIRAYFEKDQRRYVWQLKSDHKGLGLNTLEEKTAYFDGQLKKMWENQDKKYKDD